MVVVIKSIKNRSFYIFSETFLTCRTVFTKISNRNEFYLGNLPKTGQNLLIWLNEKLTDQYPVPNIQDVSNILSGAHIFTCIDLQRACHQIPVARDDIPKTAITAPFGLYEFMFMTFGLRNAGQTLRRHLHAIFGDLDFVFPYIDDICIASKNAEIHKAHLRTVFQRLRDNGLAINAEKCQIGQSCVNFLGHCITDEGISQKKKKFKP